MGVAPFPVSNTYAPIPAATIAKVINTVSIFIFYTSVVSRNLFIVYCIDLYSLFSKPRAKIAKQKTFDG